MITDSAGNPIQQVTICCWRQTSSGWCPVHSTPMQPLSASAPSAAPAGELQDDLRQTSMSSSRAGPAPIHPASS